MHQYTRLLSFIALGLSWLLSGVTCLLAFHCPHPGKHLSSFPSFIRSPAFTSQRHTFCATLQFYVLPLSVCISVKSTFCAVFRIDCIPECTENSSKKANGSQVVYSKALLISSSPCPTFCLQKKWTKWEFFPSSSLLILLFLRTNTHSETHIFQSWCHHRYPVCKSLLLCVCVSLSITWAKPPPPPPSNPDSILLEMTASQHGMAVGSFKPGGGCRDARCGYTQVKYRQSVDAHDYTAHSGQQHNQNAKYCIVTY